MTNRFDHILPSIAISIDLLAIETKDKHEGCFTIKNTGGGILAGRVLSRNAGLVFTPNTWEGNRQTINYSFNAATAGLSTGQSMESVVYILSNGGEAKLPLSAKLAKMSITTNEGTTIANLQDFYDYAQIHPAQARRLFVDSEFYMLLLAIGYEYMEVYESLHKDSNRERAMDNFFILSGLKGKTKLSIAKTGLEFTQKPGASEMLYGSIAIKKSDGGYVDAPITTAGDSKWLNCYASRLVQSDFDEGLIAMVNFSIDPLKISGTYARELVTIGAESTGDNTVEIVYRRTQPVVFTLNRTSYHYDDKGVIQVANNTGKDIKIEVYCPESYVRFSARSYVIGTYGEIPFDIKLSAFLSAQMLFRKVPYMKTEIEVKAAAPGQVRKKLIPLIVGEW